MDKYPFRVTVYYGQKRPVNYSFQFFPEAWDCYTKNLRRPGVSGAELVVLICKVTK